MLIALADGPSGAEVLLTKRSRHLTNHRGEMTLSYDSGDDLTTILLDIDGNGVANMTIYLEGDQTGFNDFVF